MLFVRSTSTTKFHRKVEKPGMDKDKEKQRKQEAQALMGLKQTLILTKDMHYEDITMTLHELSNIALKS